MNGQTLSFFVLAVLAFGLSIFILSKILPVLLDVIRFIKNNEPLQPIDVIIVDYLSKSESRVKDDMVLFLVKRTDGVISKRLLPHYTQTDYCDINEAKKKIGSHMTLYTRPCAPRLLFSEASLKDLQHESTMSLFISSLISLAGLTILFCSLYPLGKYLKMFLEFSK